MCAREKSLHESRIGLHLFVRVEQRIGFLELNTISCLGHTRGENILSCLSEPEDTCPRSMSLIARTIFFPRYLSPTSSRYREPRRFNRKSILTRMLIGDIGLVANLPLPPPCSRRSTGRSGRRNKGDSRTCSWSWSGRPWVSCSKTVLRSRYPTHISLLPFCASRPRPRFSLLLPYALKGFPLLPRLYHRLFYAKLAPGDNSASSRPRGRLDISLRCSLSPPCRICRCFCRLKEATWSR